MKHLTVLTLLLTFPLASAQNNPGTKLTMSPAAQQSMIQNSLKYTGRACLTDEHMAVWDAQPGATPAILDRFYKGEVERMKAGAKLDDLGPFQLHNKFYPGKGGYIYLAPLKRNYGGYFTEIVMVPFQGTPHILVYVCAMPAKRT